MKRISRDISRSLFRCILVRPRKELLSKERKYFAVISRHFGPQFRRPLKLIEFQARISTLSQTHSLENSFFLQIEII